MKRIVSLVLALAMVLSLCIFTTASADDGFVDGKFTKTPPHHRGSLQPLQ